MSPKISVCIPTYNGSKYLSECLESILEQTFTDFEVLVVDDHSSDETVQIVQKYQNQDARIQLVINPKNLGLVGNWNRCVELAQGEWIKFVFQDDFIQPTCLEKLWEAGQINQSFVSCRRDFLFEDEFPKEQQRYYKNLPSLDDLWPGKTEISAQDYCQGILKYINRIYTNFVGEPTSVMLNRRLFSRLDTFNSNLVQLCDLEYWARVATHTGLMYVPEPLATLRVHSRSTTNINQKERDYRKNILDPLIVIHDFVYHPVYTSFRDIIHHQDPSLNVEIILADQAYNARRIAERAASDSSNPDFSLLQEWQNLGQLYPQLLKLSKRNTFQRLMNHGLYRWNLLTKTRKKH